MIFPQEVLTNILEYTGYGQECLLNKLTYKTSKTFALAQFYDNVAPTNTFCGHQNRFKCIKFQNWCWVTDDEECYTERVYTNHQFHVCRNCFVLGLYTFMKKYKRVPFYRGDGEYLNDIIIHLRTTIPQKEYLQFISNSTYSIMTNVSLNTPEEFNCDYYHRIKNNVYIPPELDTIVKREKA